MLDLHRENFVYPQKMIVFGGMTFFGKTPQGHRIILALQQDVLKQYGTSQKYLWVRRRVSGGSRPSQKSSTAQKWAKIDVFGQNSAGRAGDSFSHVVSALKCSTIMFCVLQNFYTMVRRPPAMNKKLKNITFLLKMCIPSKFLIKIVIGQPIYMDPIFQMLSRIILKYSDFIFYVATTKNNKFDFCLFFERLK